MWLFTEITDPSVCVQRSLTGLFGVGGLWQGVIGIRLGGENASFRKVFWSGDELVLSSPKNRLYIFICNLQMKECVHILKQMFA